MALVAYENSDESESEVDESEEKVAVNPTLVVVQDAPKTEKISDVHGDTGNAHPKLVRTLPQPKNSEIILDAEELTKRLLFSSSSLPKNHSSASVSAIENSKKERLVNDESSNDTSSTSVRKPVKITLPSLSEFIDDEETKPKKLKHSTKGSGLFSLLPAPKNLVVKETNRKLIPRTVSKVSSAPKQVIPKKKTVTKNQTQLTSYADSGEESGEEAFEIDFFSLNKAEIDPETSNALPLVESGSIETCFPHQSNLNPSFDQKQESSTAQIISVQGATEETYGPVPQEALPVVSEETSELQLDDEAILKLCGRRGRQEIAEMQIIDVCGETHLPDPKEWLTKQLTEEQETRSHSHRRRDGPTTQQRRKHQITYLAFQAKEHELELKNQWAQNKMSRKQTQAKYGF